MRLAVSIALLALVLAAAGALAAWGNDRAEGATARYRVEAVGPEGPILDESVEVDAATALTALLAAAAARDVDVSTEQYPGMGTYVRAIDGIAARGGSGWIYAVHRDGAWHHGDRSAASYALETGDRVRWSWTDA